jgi:glycosyltransferase involved in cell wall biosynthesis
MLTLDAHESQGFALQEAMSCNVPLLVFDINSVYDEYGTSFFNHYKPLDLKATSVPYWSDKCGLKTNELNDIPEMIDQMINTYQTFEPRKFIIDNLSEEVCMKRILDFHNSSVSNNK